MTRHPDDEGVLLGAVGAVRPGIADAVVSMCRMGAPLEGVAPEDHVEFWVIDKEDANNDLAGQLLDAALTVRELRQEGKTVLLHCVHARTRTPTVAAVYGALVTGSTPARRAGARRQGAAQHLAVPLLRTHPVTAAVSQSRW